MSKIILTVAALSTIAFTVPAVAGDYDAGERAAFAQTQREQATFKLPLPVLVEGRNATFAPTAKPKVESYITQQIELDARSER